MPAQPRLALLIDATRLAVPDAVGGTLAALAAHGRVTVRLAFADWRQPMPAGWDAALQAGAVQAAQVGAAGRIAALAVAAMDLLHAGALDGVCFLPGDAALLPLAQRLRAAGLTVIGAGADAAFAPACDERLPLPPSCVAAGVLAAGSDAADAGTGTGIAACAPANVAPISRSDPPPGLPPVRPAPRLAPPPFPSAPQSAAELAADARLLPMLREAMAACAVEDGWAWLGAVSQRLRKLEPDFDPRRHGYAKLTELVEAAGCFELGRRGGGWHARPAAVGVPGGADGSAATGHGAEIGAKEVAATGTNEGRAP